jgi:hypothetical protein
MMLSFLKRPTLFLHLIKVFYYHLGDKALHQVLDDARKIAERCTNPADRDQILKTVGDIESMVDALCELRQLGKVVYPNMSDIKSLFICS